MTLMVKKLLEHFMENGKGMIVHLIAGLVKKT